MATTPTWQAARNGLPGDPGAVDASAQVNQFLGTHASTLVYTGISAGNAGGSAFLIPNGAATNLWQLVLGPQGHDWDVPFVMAGSTLGRITAPVLPVGNGADLVVTLSADSAGNPGAPICSTTVPASWLTSLSAVSAASGPPSQLIISETSGPLATSMTNTYIRGPGTTVNWPYPSSSGGATAGNPTSCNDGAGYFVQVGGSNAGGTAVTDVFSIGWTGGTTLNNATVQSSLPIAHKNGAAEITASTVAVFGGQDATGTTTANVFTAGYTAGTGTVATWSQQTSLPQALYNMASASANGVVYLVGGTNSGGTTQATCYWAAVTNGQITSWNTGPPLPFARASMFAAVVNGFLVAAGGADQGGTTHADTVYTVLDPVTGAPHMWQTGPQLPVAAGATSGNPQCSPVANAVVINAGSLFQLAVDATGIGLSWSTCSTGGLADFALFPYGNGAYQAFNVGAAAYVTFPVTPVAYVSIPLPNTALTNGATYHVTFHQRAGSGDNDNYLRMMHQTSVYVSGLTGLQATYGTGSWTAMSPTHASIPVTFFSNAEQGQLIHTWDDNGARISTLVYASTPDQRLLGILDATTQPSSPLNAQPTFTGGTGYWNAVGGTLGTSTAHVQGGVPVSGLLTPSGSASSSYVESVGVTVYPVDAYQAQPWVYSPTGYASVQAALNWYTSAGTYVSTTFGSVTSVAAGTWTQLAVGGTTTHPPATAALGTVLVIESGTPPNTALLYVSTAALVLATGQVLGSAESVNYPAFWPNAGFWPPTGTTALA